MDKLDHYIQDALDLVEFANGPVTSTWGKRRADLGHPAPFGMKLLGVGNEQWGPDYLPRFEAFQKVLKAKYPDVQLVASADPFTDRPAAKEQSAALRKMNADLIDEHFYRTPDWFLAHASQYDAYPRTGSKIFVGEYAAHTTPVGSGDSRNVWQAALAEAAFLTGLERNADVVRMSVVRTALRPHRCVAVDTEPDLVRQPALIRDAQLLRAAVVRHEPRRHRAADHS